MADEQKGVWKDVGPTGANLIQRAIDSITGVERRLVENRKTGEICEIWKYIHQSTEEAIEKDQFFREGQD